MTRLEILDKISTEDLIELRELNILKKESIDKQDDAAKMRDLEKIIMRQHPHLPYVETKEIEIYLRDRKINKIINE